MGLALMRFYLVIFIIILLGCNDKKETLIKIDTFLPNGPKNTQYIYDSITREHSINEDTFMTTIVNKDKACITVKDTLKMSDKKTVTPLKYKICYLDNTLVAITNSNEFIKISHTSSWYSKVFSYYPIPKDRSFVQECKLIKQGKEIFFTNLTDILEIKCTYINEVKTNITHIYKYASHIGMVEKIELANGVEVLHLKLNRIKTKSLEL